MNQLVAMRVFLRTVETGSVTRAAIDLAIPKSTASKLLVQLEAHLETKLLLRSTRSLSLTAEGDEYYRRIGPLLANLQDVDADLQQRGSGLGGRVRVDIHSSMANMVLIPALEEFRARHPGIHLAIGISDRPVSLIGEAVDCVVRLGRLSDTSLIARTVYQDHLITCASPSYLEKHPVAGEPEALRSDHRLVGYFSALTGEMKPLLFEKDDRSIAIEAVDVSTNDSYGHVNMMRNGLGIGQTYLSTARPYLESGELVQVLEEWTNRSEPISILYPPAKDLNKRVRVFIDWLVDHLHGQRDAARRMGQRSE